MQTFKKPLHAAFIGGSTSSAIGLTHFNASRMDGHFIISAGCFSRDAIENIKSGSAYGVPPNRTYSDWKKLIECEINRIDVIFVLTPIPSHKEIVIAALEAGFPVVCEKPLALSSEDCTLISNTLEKKQGYLAVTLNYSGYPMVRQLQKMVSEGRLGKLQQIIIEMPQESFLRKGVSLQDWRKRDYTIPTVSLDLGVHVHHLVNFISGGLRPLRVVGDESSFGNFSGIIDNVYAIAHYEENLRVQMWWGKTALGNRNGLRIRVFGNLASAEWLQENPEFLHLADNEGNYFTLDRSSGEAKLAQHPRYNRFKAGHPSGFTDAFANLYEDIANDIREFKQKNYQKNPFVFGASHSEDGLKLIESIHESSKKSIWVNV